jgi:hypothetical protein
MGLTSNTKDKDWISVRQAIARLGSSKLGPTSTPTFLGVTTTTLTISGLTDNSLIYPVSGLLTSLGVAANGKIPIGSTGAAPVLATLTATADQTTITNGAGSVTVGTVQDINTTSSPTWVGTTWTGKLDGGSQASPIDVTNTRKYGLEFHYSGNDYDVTGIRSRAQLVTTDTTATALGGLFQAANNDGVDAGVLMGFMAEAIGKSTSNASTITTMRGGLIGTEWGAKDTVTNLKTLHLRGHSRNAADDGSFGTGYALYIENEAVGGNGQAYDAGIYFKGTNLSAGNKAFDYGIDFTGATYTTAVQKWPAGTIQSTGDVVFQPTVDSTTAYQWLASGGGTPLLNIDTTNKRIGFGTNSPVTDFEMFGTTFRLRVKTNSSTGSSGVEITNNANRTLCLSMFGSNHAGTIFGISKANMALFEFNSLVGILVNTAAGMPLIFGASNTEVMRFAGDLNVGIHEKDPETLVEITGAAPTITGHVSTRSNDDDSGAWKLRGKREDGAGTETETGTITMSHDGAGVNDQLAKLVLGVNTGSGVVDTLALMSTADWVINKTSGVGIKVDLAAPTFGFADIIGDQFSKNTGGTRPTLTAYNGVVNAWLFGNGDEAFITYHIPHDYVAGTDIHLHVHWSQNNAGATGGTVDFRYTAIYAKGHNRVSGGTFTAVPITALFSSIDINDGNSGLAQYQQHLTEVTISAATATGALFDRDDFEPDGVIELTLEMDATNLTGTPSIPFIHYVDIHYQTTGVFGTKSRTPDFYA